MNTDIFQFSMLRLITSTLNVCDRQKSAGDGDSISSSKKKTVAHLVKYYCNDDDARNYSLLYGI